MLQVEITGKRLRRLLFLTLILVLAAGWTGIGHTETGIQIINASGNQNIELSVDPVRKNEGYSTILYDNRNGLPTSEANAIAQTGDGFIWIGSYAGLIRYDGNTFERIDSTTGISNVRCLYVDSQDRLWIGTNDSGVFLMSRGIIGNWNQTNGIKSASIRTIIEDENGIVYIGSTAGIAMIDTEMNLSVLKDERIDGQTIRSCRRGADGLIYGLTQIGDLFTMRNGELITFLSHEECRISGILAIFPDPVHPGNLYLGTDSSLVYNGNLERNFASVGVKDIAPLSYTECFEYINGEIWICAGNGIGKLDAEGFHRLKNVPMNNSIGHLITDYEGNLWFSSTRQGIMKIVPNQFSDLFERYDIPAAIVNSTCVCGRQLFIGTDTGLIVVEDGKKVDSIPLTEAVTASGTELETTDLLTFLNGVRIRSVVQDSKGRLWIATWRKYGLLRYDRGKLTAFTQQDGLFSDQVRVSIERDDGSIMVANTGGVSIIKDDAVTASYGVKDGIKTDEILTAAEGFNQEIILGSDGGGIYVINAEGTKHIGLADGLNSEVILRIKRSRDLDVYWIVTSNSLAFMTPDFQVTTIRQFPYPNNYDLFENSKGDVWVLSSSGIYVVGSEQLLENGQIEPEFYGISSGLPYVATANSYSVQTAEGDLYIASTMGVVKVNTEKPFEDFSELKVILPYIDADGTRYYPDSAGDFSLPGFVRKLTIYPYIFNYSLIDPLVSYRLEGFDLSDVTVSRSKLMPVDYTNLGIGSYHFTMTIKDPVGHSEQTASFRITKGKEMSASTAGTIIMLSASLLLMGGTLVYTVSYRKRKRLEDKLISGMILSNIALTVGQLLSYGLEHISVILARELMVAGYTVYYICLVLFCYLLLMYLDYCSNRDIIRARKMKLLYGILFFIYSAIMIINIKTGWIFSVTEGNAFVFSLHDELVYLPALPVCFYIFLSLVKLYKINRRLVIIGIVMIGARLAGELCFRGISSTSFIYTLIIVCIYLFMMNQTMNEEEP